MEIENGFAELKNRLRGAGFILRSRAPELIYQEIYALLTVYQALCSLQMRAAEHGGTDPDRISFTVTVQLARLAVAAQAAADTTVLDAARLLRPARKGEPERAGAHLSNHSDRSSSRSTRPSKASSTWNDTAAGHQQA